jgi:Fe-S-cluster-containing hydrogenase component 2
VDWPNLRTRGYLSPGEIARLRPSPLEAGLRGAVAVIECVEDIPCNPCEEACPNGAIVVGDDITRVPRFYEERCTGCGLCIPACPGLAIFVIDQSEGEDAIIKMPYEFLPVPREGQQVQALDRQGRAVCRGTVTKVVDASGYNKTIVLHLAVPRQHVMDVRGIKMTNEGTPAGDPTICRCMEVTRGEILRAIREGGARSIPAIKRRTTAGMGVCQGKTCSGLITGILCQEIGVDPECTGQDTARPPVRPLALDALGGDME